MSWKLGSKNWVESTFGQNILKQTQVTKFPNV